MFLVLASIAWIFHCEAFIYPDPEPVHNVQLRVEVHPNEAIPGDSISIYVIVDNQGDFVENLSVAVFYNDTIAAPSISITNLLNKTSETLNFTWDTTGISGYCTIKATASVAIAEGGLDNITSYFDEKVILNYRALTIKLAGDTHYLLNETSMIELSASAKDALTMEYCSGANVSLEIYDSDGDLWASPTMTEDPLTLGTYEWISNDAISDLGLKQGAYFVKVYASYRGGPTANDALLMHMIQPYEGDNSIQPYEQNNNIPIFIAAAIIAAACSLALIFRRQITNKYRSKN